MWIKGIVICRTVESIEECFVFGSESRRASVIAVLQENENDVDFY